MNKVYGVTIEEVDFEGESYVLHKLFPTKASAKAFRRKILSEGITREGPPGHGTYTDEYEENEIFVREYRFSDLRSPFESENAYLVGYTHVCTSALGVQNVIDQKFRLWRNGNTSKYSDFHVTVKDISERVG